MIINMNYWWKVIQRILILLVSIFAFYLIVKCAFFYVPFVIAFIIAMLVEPLIKFLHSKTKLSRRISSIIVLVVIFGLLITGLTYGVISIMTESFKLLGGINEYSDTIYNTIQDLIEKFRPTMVKLPSQITDIGNNSLEKVIETVSKFISDTLNGFIKWITSLPSVGINVVITILATYFMCADKIYILDQVEHHFPRAWVKKWIKQIKEIMHSLGSYIKAQAILIVITFFVVLIGLYVLKIIGLNIEYPLLSALGIGFVDALPILGSGTVMVPWAVIAAIKGDFGLAIGLLIVYAVIIIVRQILEPKIVSNQIGIHPIFTLLAMYTGFKIIGLLGILVGPIALIIIKHVYGSLIDKGIVKTIFDKK